MSQISRQLWLSFVLIFSLVYSGVSAEDIEIFEEDPRIVLTNLNISSLGLSSINIVALYIGVLLIGGVIAAIVVILFAFTARRRYDRGPFYYYDNNYYNGNDYGYYNGVGTTRSSDSIDWESLNILDYISMMEEMWRKFDVKDVECQKRVLCELHQNEKSIGPAATKVVNALGYMRYLSLFNLPGELRGLFEEYQDAADKGRSLKKDCGDIYDTCNFSFKETYMKYVGKNDKNTLEN